MFGKGRKSQRRNYLKVRYIKKTQNQMSRYLQVINTLILIFWQSIIAIFLRLQSLGNIQKHSRWQPQNLLNKQRYRWLQRFYRFKIPRLTILHLIKPRLPQRTGAKNSRGKRLRFVLIAIATMLLVIPQLLFFQNVAYAANPICGTPGKDDPVALSGIINTYYPGAAASASTGATSISLGPALPAGNTPITAGDMLLIIQMQDAQIDATDTDSYGDGVPGGNASGWKNLNTSGAYQYVVATNSVPITGGTINLSQALTYTFTNASQDSASGYGQRRYQVIRVPQYPNATISGTVSSYAWDGSIGGVFAADIAGSLTFSSGTIDVAGQGFRGGGGTNLGGDGTTGAASRNSDYRHTAPTVSGISAATAPTGTNNYDASKGEGIAGSPRWTRNGGFPPVVGVTDNGLAGEGYANGSFGRGAPGNAGGGGTDPNKGDNGANTGGGGGANYGSGGKGGDSWTGNNFRAAAGPYTSTNDGRMPYGGFGGTGLGNVVSVNKIFLGGGGGAGSSNNSTSTTSVPSGGGGGGMVIVRSGQILGTGTINAQGIQGVTPPGTDAGGGGGAGGTVLIQSVNTPSTAPSITINAYGGAGLSSNYNDHGPGGGGGGGYIAYQGFTPTTNVAGGLSGNDLAGTAGPVSSTHNAAADPYGATNGSSGLATQTTIPAQQVKPGASCLPSLTVTKTTSTPSVIKPSTGTSTAIYTITTTNSGTQGDAINVVISDALPTNFTYASTTSVTLTGGATQPTTSNPTAGSTNPAWGSFTIPPSGQVQIVFNATISAAATLGTYQNPATATYTDPTRTTPGITTTASYNSASSTGEDVTLIGLDYGDAPDASTGTSAGNYQTTSTDSGASHTILSTLKLGTNAPDADNGTLQNANADADDTNGTDDEDGVTFPTTLTIANTSYSATVNVTNTTGSAIPLVGWIDFDKNGVFAASEGVSQSIPNNASPQNVTLTWTGISGLTTGNTYARFRLSDSASLTTSTSTGAVGNGEVEDYPVTITNIDYGDAPDTGAGSATGNYQTTFSDGGGSHTILSTLKLGTNAPDADDGTLQNASANADDTNNIDDEDGVTFPTALSTANTSYSATVNVTNTTGSNTYLVGWIDFNKDGVFQSTEGVAQTIANNASPQNVTLNWASLSGLTTGNTYARFRLSDSNTLTTSTPNGAVGNGELEDYLVTIVPPIDYGDAPDTYGTDTTANNSSGDPVGASHVINNNIYLGTVIPDAESNASIPYNGTGDDVTGIDDEDGVASFPSLQPTTTTYSVDVKVTNNTGSTANLIGWIDFNRDGKFQASEAQTATVATGTTNVTTTLTWNSLSPTAGITYARFRLTTDGSITTSTPGGAATNGEVEDYQLTVGSNPPKLLLSKRITAIKSFGTTTNFTTVFTPASIPSDTTATDSSWPANYLQGGGVSDSNPSPADPVDAFRLRPGDEVEYTIYFVNAGAATAQNVKICDLVPSNQAFLTNAFSGVSPATGGLANQQRGIAASINIPPATNHVLQSYTNVSDGDTAEFYAPNLTVPISCSGTNTNGAVVIRLGDIPKSTGSGVPENSYGFFRFQAKVN